MDFIKKYWWVLLLVLVAVFFVSNRMRKAQAAKALAQQTQYQTQLGAPNTGLVQMVGNQPSTRPGTIVGTTGPETIGTQYAGTTLTRSQCRATCKGKCGPRCVLNLSRRCKSVKRCWDNCKNSYCNYITGEV